MKYLVCICSGGLGNRLRPLSSCIRLARESDRELLVWWTKDHRCSLPFNSMFKNRIEFIDESFIDGITEGKFYIHSYTAIEAIIHVTYNNHFRGLLTKLKHDSTAAMSIALQHDHDEYVVVISDDWIGYDSDPDFILALEPVDEIQQLIESFPEANDIVGVHARGTDFFCLPQMYIAMMEKYRGSVFYLATDDKAMENEIARAYPDQIITLLGKVYATKKDPSLGYRYNTLMTDEAMIFSVAELYMLSKTKILIGNERSSYFQIAKILHNAYHN